MMKAKKVKWFTTGGTIDSQPYDENNPPKDATNDVFSYLPSHLQAIRNEVRPDFAIELEQVFSCDSKYIGEREVRKLVRLIRADTNTDVFVITHGTDTMPRNSRLLMQYLESDLKKQGKTLIMTGAMWPLTNGEKSDGLKNLRYIVQHYDDETIFPPGVNVLMHEKVFSPEGLCKDFDRQEFFVAKSPNDLRTYNQVLRKLGAQFIMGA